jgi:hypothetical protein
MADARHGRFLLQRVHEDHHLRDGGVEAQALDVVANLLDGLVQQFLRVGSDSAPVAAMRGLTAPSSVRHSRQIFFRKRCTPSMPLVFQGFMASSGPRNMRYRRSESVP